MSAKRTVSFSNLDKKYFPSGFTKGEMIRYYVDVAATMLPHVRERPVTLIRFPDGVKGESFYEKNAPRHAPDWITTYPVPRREHEGHINYILVNNAETLAWCANTGAIEFHPFLHRAPKLSQPTHIAFDLDPGEGATILTCLEVAFLLKDVLDRLGLQSFPKVSGSKGIQLYVPLNTSVTYDATTPFAKTVAELLAKKHPQLIVSEMPKALRKKRVMIDWSQNVAAKTTVAVYSMRGKRDEPFISAPVEWSELNKAAKTRDADLLYFTPAATLARIKQSGDLFAPVLKLRQKLPKEFLELGPPKRTRSSLARYAAKRDFTKTAEPAPAAPRREGGVTRFVIQKHAASHLHFDFRLEMEGTLKSWAVPKGLPYELGVKRSAFQVEDHPVEYRDFEGTIPQGQYGGGTVMVWDQGTYEILGGNYHRGDLKLWLTGKKLKGEWHIFRIKSDERKPVWLVAKSGKAMKPLSLKQEDTSVLSGRYMAQIAEQNTAQWDSRKKPSQARTTTRRKKPTAHAAKPSPPPTASRPPQGKRPAFVEPMKPLLVAQLPDGPEWAYEIKWDGYRALLLKHGADVQLLSRNNKPLGEDFPEVVDAGRQLATGSCLIDGEIVALDAQGRPTFQALQNRNTTDATIVFYAFDLLSRDGKNLQRETLEQRKLALEEVIAGSALRLSPSLGGTAEAVVTEAGNLGLEGVVAKRWDSPYVSGERSSTWQKIRLRRGQEFVVGGYRPGMHPFESVLVGYYEGKELMFAGKVRPGFTPHTRAEVWKLIKNNEIKTCPFANLPDALKKGRWGEGITAAEMKTLRWVKPKLVVEIEFTEWTSHEHLRHAAFRGIRHDKKPQDVVREKTS